MTLRFQRLLLILVSLIFLLTAILLILYNSKNNIIFFYTPSELHNSKIELDTSVRIGAFVETGSLKKIGSNKYQFNITDYTKSVKVSYEGLLPDLFKEGQGAVIEGLLKSKKHIIADKVYAKHDENYMPSSIKSELENNKIWQKKYK